MVASIFKAGEIPARIEKGVVLDVNVANYTVTVGTLSNFSPKAQTGIAFASPYQHPTNGEGIYFMPEVGSFVWLCFPSTGDRPFVLAWASVAGDDGSFQNNKWALNPGDIFLGTRDENVLILRRGGVVQIGATPLAQRFYLPLNNTIQDICENYNLQTLAGNLIWSLATTPNETDGSESATLVLQAKQFADDPSYVAELSIGNLGTQEGTDNVAISLKVFASGQTQAAENFTFLITADGNLVIKNTRDVSWTIGGKLKIYDTVLQMSPTTRLSNAMLLFPDDASITLPPSQNMRFVNQGGAFMFCASPDPGDMFPTQQVVRGSLYLSKEQAFVGDLKNVIGNLLLIMSALAVLGIPTDTVVAAIMQFNTSSSAFIARWSDYLTPNVLVDDP